MICTLDFLHISARIHPSWAKAIPGRNAGGTAGTVREITPRFWVMSYIVAFFRSYRTFDGSAVRQNDDGTEIRPASVPTFEFAANRDDCPVSDTTGLQE